MKMLTKVCFAALTLALAALGAQANGGAGPFSFQGGGFHGQSNRLPFFGQTPVPAFQAAPWYLYWPYNSHFQTPAPLMGAYYAPPGGGGMVNPYFPAPYGYGGGYGGGYGYPYPAANPAAQPAAPQVMPGNLPAK